MWGHLQVRFLGGNGGATLPPYPTVRGLKFSHLQRESRCCPHSPFGDIGRGRVRVVTHGLNLPRHSIVTALNTRV